MKRGFALKVWVYFLCISFLLLAGGFRTMAAEAKETGRPLGEMISIGDVKLEAKEAVWKKVEVSEFPIFPGVRIKTERGPSLVTLRGNRQIDVGKNSLFSFNGSDRMEITQGSIEFRLPAGSELSFRVGELTVISRPLRVSQNSLTVSPKSEATIGTISVHSNGAVTIQSFQGSLSVVNQERALLATLSSKDTVTLPSVVVNTPSRTMVAKADEKTSDDEDETRKLLGIPWWIWEVAGAGAVMATLITFGVTTREGNDRGVVPVCP